MNLSTEESLFAVCKWCYYTAAASYPRKMEAASKPLCKGQLLNPKYHSASRNLDSRQLLETDLTEYRQPAFGSLGSYYGLIGGFHSCRQASKSSFYLSIECSCTLCPCEWRLYCVNTKYPCTFATRRPICPSRQSRPSALVIFVSAARNLRTQRTLAWCADNLPKLYCLKRAFRF